MKSKLLGLLSFDEELLAQEIEKIVNFEFSPNYSEFALGEWKTCVLWNATGSKDDSIFREYEGEAQVTELGKQLEYINYLLHKTFNFDYIKWVRIFSVKRGLIIPHKDYIELKNPSVRVHIPLQTDLSCLHSEGDEVYHMRKGEIWFLDGSQPHSACSLSDTQRLSVCIDFENNTPFEKIFRVCPKPSNNIAPYNIKRDSLSKEYTITLQNLSHIISLENFDEIISLLAKVHFKKQANVVDMYEWLIDITYKSGNKQLLDRAMKMKSFFLGERNLGQVINR